MPGAYNESLLISKLKSMNEQFLIMLTEIEQGKLQPSDIVACMVEIKNVLNEIGISIMMLNTKL